MHIFLLNIYIRVVLFVKDVHLGLAVRMRVMIFMDVYCLKVSY